MQFHSFLKSLVFSGAALLDKHRPGWRSQINPNTVDVANAKKCPLGQLFGTSEEGYKRLGGDSRDFLINNGFAASSMGGKGYVENVKHLNALWWAFVVTPLAQKETVEA